MASISSTQQPKQRPERQWITGGIMAGIAFVLLLVFLIGPFFGGIYYSFTNQRLISANPTEWVGLRNYQRLLASLSVLDPVVDPATGERMVDEEGNLTYPRSRIYARRGKLPAVRRFDGMVHLRTGQYTPMSSWPPILSSCAGWSTTSSLPWLSFRCKRAWALLLGAGGQPGA